MYERRVCFLMIRSGVNTLYMKTFLFFVMFALVPVFAFAQAVPTTNQPTEAGIFGDNFQLVPCDGVAIGEGKVECDYNALINGINNLVKYFFLV